MAYYLSRTPLLQRIATDIFQTSEVVVGDSECPTRRLDAVVFGTAEIPARSTLPPVRCFAQAAATCLHEAYKTALEVRLQTLLWEGIGVGFLDYPTRDFGAGIERHDDAVGDVHGGLDDDTFWPDDGFGVVDVDEEFGNVLDGGQVV